MSRACRQPVYLRSVMRGRRDGREVGGIALAEGLEPFLFRSIATARSSVSPIVVSNVASRRVECLLYLVHQRMSKSLLA
jgi:hypothetical protein